jgi:hypothetical protein
LSTGVHGELTARTGLSAFARAWVGVMRACLRPFGYLAFVVALGALSSAARLLGDEHELGFFAGRLSGMIWRYPEITRRGVQMAWLAWAVMLAVAISPADPITSRWDEALLLALAMCVTWRRTRAGHRVER